MRIGWTRKRFDEEAEAAAAVANVLESRLLFEVVLPGTKAKLEEARDNTLKNTFMAIIRMHV